MKRFYQFFRSFQNIKNIYFYYGTLDGNQDSHDLIKECSDMGYVVKTKSVKIMKKPIDVSGIALNNPSVLENFIRKSLLREMNISTIEYLNGQLADLNRAGRVYIEDRKCNFDVEMAVQMHDDMKSEAIQNFVIMSGDSDFADVIEQLHSHGNTVYIFSTAGRVSRELNESGAIVYDLKKLKDFICWKKEMDPKYLSQAKGTPLAESP